MNIRSANDSRSLTPPGIDTTCGFVYDLSVSLPAFFESVCGFCESVASIFLWPPCPSFLFESVFGDYSVVLRFLVLQPVVLRPVVLCTTSPTAYAGLT